VSQIIGFLNGVHLPKDIQVGPAKDGLAPAEIDPAVPVCGTR
jgi:hypothetical protein